MPRPDAETSNGKISTDFAIDRQRGSGRKSLRGTVGEGGPTVLKLRSSNGNIQILGGGLVMKK
jgi:hypothetical protein